MARTRIASSDETLVHEGDHGHHRHIEHLEHHPQILLDVAKLLFHDGVKYLISSLQGPPCPDFAPPPDRTRFGIDLSLIYPFRLPPQPGKGNQAVKNQQSRRPWKLNAVP